MTREQEDVCPVTVFPDGDWEAFLASLDKKDRHEIRRKVRRAEVAGEVRFSLAELDAASADTFIDLHQARWGDQGLFPATEGGDRSRRFLHRLTELEAAEGPDAQLQLGHVRVGERLIFATVGFDDGNTCFFYNAGMDPDARELSPGVTGTAAYMQDRLAAGRRRFDFLRGNEAYKYEWGARDEPIHRLLVRVQVDVNAPAVGDPCLDVPLRPAPLEADRVRVVELVGIGHQRRRPGARLLAADPHRPAVLRRARGQPGRRQRRPALALHWASGGGRRRA